MEATAKTLFELSQDFDAIENARRRNEYFAMIARKDATINEQAAQIAELLAEIERLRNNAK